MRQFFKRLLLPVALAAVTQTSIVSAENIRLIGPNGEVQSSPQFNSEIVRSSNVNNDGPTPVIGPTSESDTLWSIATQLRPSSKVSVQQTLLAIYRLNPQAFENQNIHSLIPGSVLRVPSLAQVSSVSTQEAVEIMAAHKARLEHEQSSKSQPSTKAVTPKAEPKPVVTETKPTNQPTESTSQPTESTPEVVNSAKPMAETPVESDANKSDESKPSSESEIQALEEKNHRLRLMLAEVQTEVSGLKQELGDQSRIRTEVEKLLQEERVKREEMERLAPSQFDQLLANNWVLAGLALIPGLLIALLVMMFLGRRSSSNQTPAQSIVDTPLSPAPTVAPVIAGGKTVDELDEDLLLDDDLFGSMEDSEALFDESADKQTEKSSENDEDIFADLDVDELDFDLGGEDDEDLFAAIDDAGDLDTNFSALTPSNNGISVNRDEQAIGLEDMERALDQANHAQENDDDVGFDLSDDGEMSQAEIESLLAADEDSEELETPSLEQSMLDELFSQHESEVEDENLFDFDDLLGEDNEQASDKKRQSAEHDVPTSFTSDEDLDNLFADIESQADSEFQQANSVREAADDESIFGEDDTALLDDYLDDEALEEDSDDSDIMSELDDLLGRTGDTDIPDIDENSTDLLDDFLEELNEAPKGYSSFLAEEDSEAKADEGLELFDELLDIEKSAYQEQSDISFDTEADSSAKKEPQIIANEFGIPQDDDWAFDKPEVDSVLEDAEQPSVDSEVKSTDEAELSELEDILAELGDFELPEYTEAEALTDSKSDDETVVNKVKSDSEANTVVREVKPTAEEVQPELDDVFEEFDDLELPEYTEEDALADSADDEELLVTEIEPSSEEAQPELDDIFEEFDDLELPEYTEDDALADVDLEGEQPKINLSDISKREFDEEALSDWLSEDKKSGASFKFDKPVDAKSADSAGMDIDAMLEMGGEDWNGFNLTAEQKASIPDDVPEAERDIWQPEYQIKEPEVAEESWGDQDDMADFDPASRQFMTIDDLMAEAERREGDAFNPDDEELKLDVGLNEFPDVIGDISDIDVDSDSEAASKLDLAKIYVEMNDDKGAIKLLEEAIVDGNDDIRQQAKRLIDVINGRV